jgi:DNA end-binding protein Ku
MVNRNEIEKGYEYEKDQYLLFTEAELEEVEPDSARTMEIIEFVKVEEMAAPFFGCKAPGDAHRRSPD